MLQDLFVWKKYIYFIFLILLAHTWNQNVLVTSISFFGCNIDAKTLHQFGAVKAVTTAVAN